MTEIGATRNTSDVTPYFESDIFASQPNARFAVGLVADGLQPVEGKLGEHLAYGIFRANVYADEMSFLDPTTINSDQTETDKNDERSHGFAIIENQLTVAGGALRRVVAAMRYIEKTEDQPSRLPVEEYFPEAFDDELPVGTIEISRYIIRHEDKTLRGMLRTSLFDKVLSSIVSRDLGPTFAVVDKSLERLLQVPEVGVPLTHIADEKYIPDYNSKNVAIEIDTQQMARMSGISLNEVDALNKISREFTYFGEVRTGENQVA